MVEWRELGVVQDSDDEAPLSDGELSSNSKSGVLESTAKQQRPSSPTQAWSEDHSEDVGISSDRQPKTNNSDELVLENGSRNLIENSIQAAAGSNPTLEISTNLSDAPSSPLSDLPDSWELEYPSSKPQNLFPSKPDTSLQAVSDNFEGNETSGTDVAPFLIDHESRGRTFRHRNPIQLHPYLLENEIYRQTLRGRGVRPVAVAAEAAQASSSQNETQNQYEPTLNDVHPNHLSRGSQDLFASSSESLSRQSRASSDQLSAEADLPSLADLLRRPAYTGNSRKRRKIWHSESNLTARSNSTHLRPTLISPITPSIVQQNEVAVLTEEIQRSPETDHRQSPSKKRWRAKKFRMPKEAKENALPTPLPSSEIGKVKFNAAAIHSGVESASESDSNTQILIDSNHTNQSLAPLELTPSIQTRKIIHSRSSSVHVSSSSESEKMHTISKRIRGVLPASWLRLDQQAKHRPKSSSRAEGTKSRLVHLDSEQQKGVAKRVQSHSTSERQFQQPPSAGRINISDVLDDSDAVHSDGSLMSTRTNERPTQQHGDLELKSITQDIEEEDWIDPMLPAISRSRPRRKDGKRQLRLIDSFSRGEHLGGMNQARPRERHDYPSDSHTRSIQHIRKKAQRKHEPQFSIVDATRAVPRQSMPDFVRVARRHAASRSDRGRHGPSGKSISLHTHKENTDVDQALDNWKNGSIQQLRDYASRSYPARPTKRAPLRPRSHNEQQKPVPLQHLDYFSGAEEQVESRLSTSPPIYEGKFTSYVETANKGRLGDATNDPLTKPQPGQMKEQSIGKLTRTNPHRPGQLETFQTLDNFLQDQTASHRKQLGRVRTGNGRWPKPRNHSNPLLERYLQEDNQHPRPSLTEARLEGLEQSRPDLSSSKLSRVRQPRKRLAKGLQDDNNQMLRLKSPEYIPTEDLSNVPAQIPQAEEHLSGLGPYGTQYTHDFGIKPLPIGTFFHYASFIGSGAFRDGLDIHERDLEKSATSTILCYESKECRFGEWTEEASNYLEELYSYVSRLLDPGEIPELEEISITTTRIAGFMASISSSLKSVVEYYAKGLSFFDSVDRISFTSRTSDSLGRLLETIRDFEMDSTHEQITTAKSRLKIRTLTLATVASFINVQIAKHSTIPREYESKADEMFKSYSLSLMSSTISCITPAIQQIMEHIERSTISESGFHEEHVVVEAVIVLFNVLEQAHSPGFTFWDVFSSIIDHRDIRAFNSVKSFEQTWSTIFSMLPFQEFDSNGIVRPGKRASYSDKGWITIRKLYERIFELHSASARHHTATLNCYLRATMCRSFALINRWGWHRCEAVLGIMFDFFAKRDLASLQGEDNRAHPDFLQDLDRDLVLRIQPGDRSFDIFLKLLATGLDNLRSIYTPKKMHNVAWRFLPNHGRGHDKENELQESDLDALRNHHNLLCVLYWASPTGFRINLDLIQNLVDFSTSHSELCRLNARTWANLARFQLSTEEEVQFINPFIEWFRQMLNKSLLQHRQARSEAEAIFQEANSESMVMTKDLLEATIASNEKQVENTLTLILSLLASVLKGAKNIDMATTLLEKSSIEELLHTFVPARSRFSKVISVALDSYMHYFNLLAGRLDKNAFNGVGEDNDDSQDYGEWLAFDEVNEETAKNSSTGSISETVTEALQNLLSNCFGAENFYDETLLTKTVDVWVKHCYVQNCMSNRDWNFYIDRQGQGSWYRLRDTEQTRKFAGYFYASVLKQDPQSFNGYPWPILSTWMVSLVERESMLKYQHMLTTELLNLGDEHPLLNNLPFWRENKTQQYNVTLRDIRERRLGLLSSIFSNMRQAVDNSALTNATRQDYSQLLKELMNVMKRNYQETQDIALKSGAYVEFVQKVVELLQQYTADICAIDRFFTDPTAFPLPATDPTYVVGRLKSYGLKLSDRSTQKQLIVFLQAVCERAAVDGQQEYLVSQLVKCQYRSQELADQPGPSLRRFLVQVVFPNYIQLVQHSVCGWILAAPVLEASRIILDNLLFNFSVSDKSTSAEMMQMCTELVRSLTGAFFALVKDRVLQEPTTLRVLSGVILCTVSALPVVDYLHRSWNNGSIAIRDISIICKSSHALEDSIKANAADVSGPDTPMLSSHINRSSEDGQRNALDDIQTFCTRNLQESLTNNWVREGDQYYFLRGASRKEIPIKIGTVEQEQMEVVMAIRKLKVAIARMPAFAPFVSEEHSIDEGSIFSLEHRF